MGMSSRAVPGVTMEPIKKSRKSASSLYTMIFLLSYLRFRGYLCVLKMHIFVVFDKHSF